MSAFLLIIKNTINNEPYLHKLVYVFHIYIYIYIYTSSEVNVFCYCMALFKVIIH